MNSNAENSHYSVLLNEAVEYLEASKGGFYVDATLGAGGHTEAILDANPANKVLAFDQDTSAIALATSRLERFQGRIEIIHDNFESLKRHTELKQVKEVDGIIADLGVSSMQLDTGERGFSFRIEAPLDMRMNPEKNELTAADFLAEANEEEIANVIYEYGEERFSRRIARRIVGKRSEGEPIKTTKQLAEIVLKSVPTKKKDRVHPATKTFQALRIYINRELEVLENFLSDAVHLLSPGGKIVIISFHSLEDRIVKRTFQKLSGKCFCPRGFPMCTCGASKLVEILTKKPIFPTTQEINANPRSRSARLRAASRLT